MGYDDNPMGQLLALRESHNQGLPDGFLPLALKEERKRNALEACVFDPCKGLHQKASAGSSFKMRCAMR